MRKLTIAVVRFLAALSVLFLISCDKQEGQQNKLVSEVSENTTQPKQKVEKTGTYSISSPAFSYTLPQELTEVSGLSYEGDGKFYMVQDEEGIVFTWDEKEKAVVKSQTFGEPEDYEGIEVVNDQIFVVKHTGTLFQMKKGEADQLESKKLGNFLKGDNDIEGLGYLKGEEVLLLACKEPFLENGKYNKDLRSVYAFDLKSMSLRPQAWFYLNVYQLEKELRALPQTEEMKRVMNTYHPEKRKCLAPSGIAVHPKTGHIYLLAHRSQLLLVLSQSGKVLNAYHLDRKLFPQPEGICFKENGDLYISNEGVEGPASLLGFSYQP
ncbi:MAG: SdiA-regulated domain-containing protein [Bacteroidia bacterium]|nr:SdiA-regulated domain-containing protein [Bacteroidia bacterium]